MVFAMVGTGARLRGAAGSWMIGPHELASVIGKLELLARVGSDDRARLGSELELLDLQSQELLRLRLVDRRRRSTEVSIFSPLGARLLAARPGEVVSPRCVGRGYRLLVVAVLSQ